MARTIIIGDVHGCADELQDLLSKVGYGAGDELVFVGDLVVRGPKPNEVVQLAASLGAASVRGNHEHRLLRFAAMSVEKSSSKKKASPKSASNSNAPPESASNKGELHKSKTHKGAPHKDGSLNERERRLLKSKWLRRTAKALDAASWRYLQQMPLWLDRPQHGLRVVHAAVLPGLPIEEQSETTLLWGRCIDDNGEMSSLRDAGDLWGSRYRGPPHILFGHNALSEPQLHPWATGLDTGCVYGGRLTAMVLPAGAAVPPLPERREVLVSVPARETYVPIS